MQEETKLEFKTSEVLILDWISIPEFLEQLGLINRLLDFRDREGSTKHAASHNFVRVHIGDVKPEIHQKENNFSFGITKEKSRYANIGSVYGAVCAVTMIEKTNLINIVANKVGQIKAQQIVEDYLKKVKYYTTVNIEPGVYTLKFNTENLYGKQIFTLRKDKVAKVKKPKLM